MQRNREDNDTRQVEENREENMEKSAELGNIRNPIIQRVNSHNGQTQQYEGTKKI